MTPDRFRQDISSTISVPGDGVSAKATTAGQALGQLVQAIQNGASLSVTPNGVSAELTDGDAQWLMVQSAGSTGVPKTIRRHPASWIASFEVTRSQYEVSSSAPYAVLGSLSHSLTLYAVLEALHLGCDLSVLTGLSPRPQVSEMRDHGTQVLYATPTQLKLLFEVRLPPLSSIRWVFCGGGLLDNATRDRAREFFPKAVLREFFGASETSFIAMGDDTTPSGAVGKAYTGVDLRVLDANGRETADIGEIWVKSPYLFDGYQLGECEDTRWSDGFLSIGELGQLDQTGNLKVVGRKSRMVTIADHNVFPEVLEAHLRSRPGAEHCAVVAVPDPLRGHELVAFVEGPVNDDLAKDLISQCRSALGEHTTPRRIEFVDEIPMLDAGKPDLVALAMMLEDVG